MSKVTLVTEEGEIHFVDVEIAMGFRVVKEKLDTLTASGGNVEELPPFYFHQLNSDIMKRVIDWVTHYHVAGVPGSSANAPGEEAGAVGGVVDTWASNFLNLDISVILPLMLAARHLGVKDLIGATANAMNKIMREGKSPEECALINQMMAFGFS